MASIVCCSSLGGEGRGKINGYMAFVTFVLHTRPLKLLYGGKLEICDTPTTSRASVL